MTTYIGTAITYAIETWLFQLQLYWWSINF